MGRRRRRRIPVTLVLPAERAWFPNEVRAVRKAINRTLQSIGERPLRHPK